MDVSSTPYILLNFFSFIVRMTIKKSYPYISVTSYNSNKLLKGNVTKLKNRMVSVIKLIKKH